MLLHCVFGAHCWQNGKQILCLTIFSSTVSCLVVSCTHSFLPAGCSAGFLNVPKVLGTHTAMKSGMLAAESVYEILCSNQEDAPAYVDDGSLSGLEATDYQSNIESSWVWEELTECRNWKPKFQQGLYYDTVSAGLICFKIDEPKTQNFASTSRRLVFGFFRKAT